MGFWDYLAEHPWWALIYLLLLCFTSLALVIARRPEIEKEGTATDIKKNDAKGPRPLNG